MIRKALLALFLLYGTVSFAQNPDIPYRSASNPNYWKNRLPIPGYWQQDTYYKIRASLSDATDIISGSEELVYWNNSPDTLRYVYFHLYENAFQPGSYTDDLHRNNNFPIKYGKYESQKKGTDVTTVTVDGQAVRTELDNTIMKVWLPKPLLPNSSVKFNIDFSTYFDDGGSIRRRMKMYRTYGYKHYDGVHWYPRIAVYDRKFGWETDQHLTREFYGDFGAYDVELTLPNNYILEATGEMLNEKEVLPSELRQRLDISNFAKKPWGSAPSVVIAPDGTTKTWKFHAENVHDFAWTADPLYRIGEVDWNGIRCISMAQEPHASGWQTAAAYTARIIEFYSTNIGMYAYPKMVVCDAQDGMEYPMLTLDGGREPDYHSLLAHEVGHNWFFGMVGSNETYRALLDEGFTQFIDSWCCRVLDGETEPHFQYKSGYVRRFKDEDKYINTEVYNRYMPAAASGADETVIDTHSDMFNGALRHGGGYGEVYSKTATMLYNLQYVLGDSLFKAAFSHYFNQWKFCHPYVEDFRTSIIQYTHTDLNWFFDEWLTTSKTIDYAVKSVKKGDSADVYLVKFKRKGRSQMPVDFTVTANDGRRYNYYIPNTWFEKKTDATVLPRWIGWDKIRPTYTAKLVVPTGVNNIEIDTTHRLADANMLNNSSKMPVEMRFDSRIYNTPSWEHYSMRARPDFWYNNYDGIKAGFYIGGDYLGFIHQFDLVFHFNTGAFQNVDTSAEINKFDRFSFIASYRTPTNKLIRNSSVYFNARHMDGLDGGMAGFEVWDRNRTNRFYAQYKVMYRADSSDLTYLLYKDDWTPEKFNNTITVGYEHPYSYKKGNGNIQLSLRSSAIGSDYDYQSLTLNVVNRNDLGRININTRVFGQIGTGSNWAPESMLYLAGASPEELMDSKYTRSAGVLPESWGGYGSDLNHLQQGGGLNLRGYAGYLAPQYDWYGDIRKCYKGSTGYAINAEIEFQELFRFVGQKWMPKVNRVMGLTTYLFGDFGGINFSKPGESLAMGDFRADAGAGCALTIKRFPPLQIVKPLTIRFDMPLFLNSTPYASPDYVQFRWVLGISRAF